MYMERVACSFHMHMRRTEAIPKEADTGQVAVVSVACSLPCKYA